jgi:phosphatidylglycerophosphatase A
MLLALGFGTGLARRAPGTWGTAAGLGVYALIAPWGVEALFLAALAASVGGIAICGIAARRLGVHDHPAIVWDEIAGILITLLFVPVQWPWILAGFVAFRLFDVLKPWPISWLDRHVEGGLGIMVDDILAGVAAGLLLLVTGGLLHSL